MRLLLTGFGPFSNCEFNPSQAVARQAFEILSGEGVDCSFLELEVSRIAVQEFYAGLPDKSDLFILHIGLDNDRTRLALERTAHNTADFSTPDIRGDRPRFEKISPHYLLGCKLQNPVMDVAALQASLSDGFDLSDEPGRYVCNYTYFYSIMHVGKKIRGSPFVHVPQFDGVLLKTQVAHIVLLAKTILAFVQFQ